MTTSDPVLSLGFLGSSSYSFQLGRKGYSGEVPKLTIMTNDHPIAVTLVLLSYDSLTRRLSLPLAIQSGLFDLFDMEDNTKVPVSTRDAELGHLVVEAKPRTQSVDLMIDGREVFWNHVLTPGHRYEIRWQEGPNVPWAYGGEIYEDASQLLPIQRRSSVINLKVLDDDTAPPRFSISLAPTAGLCHLSGKPPFGFLLQVTSHAEDFITVCLDKTPLKEYHGLEDIARIVNEDGKEVEFVWGIGCWEYDIPFPDDYMFEEFEPGVAYDRMFWLGKDNDNELGALDADRTYTVSVGYELTASFTTGMWGRKEELLAGSEKEKLKRWSSKRLGAGTGPLILEISEPFQFETI